MNIVKKLKLKQPDEEMFQSWYDESMDVFREDNWLGRPESSMELHLLSGTKPIDAQSFGRIEPLLDNLRLLGCFKDISLEKMLDLNHNETYTNRLAKIDCSYAQEGSWEMTSYLGSIYGAIPGRDVSLEFFSSDVEIDNLSYNSAIVEEIEQRMQEDEDFSVTGVELSAYAEGENITEPYSILDSSLVYDIFFLYGGDQSLTHEYNEVADLYGDPNEYSGVPGFVRVGNSRPIAYFFDSEEISADGSRVDDWLYDNLDSNLGAKSKLERKS